MTSELQQDGHLIFYGSTFPQGLPKTVLHVNGVASDVAKQQQALEALVWMTVDHPLDIVGVHNSTQGLQADLLESALGKAELVQCWPNRQGQAQRQRLQGYGAALMPLLDQDLAPDIDILAAIGQGQPSLTVQPGGALGAFDVGLLRQLPFLQNMNWPEFERFFYGSYPAGAPRPTLRLAYEILRGIRAGTEVMVVAHSQGTIVAALALHIVACCCGETRGWADKLRLIGYGPAIMVEDLPVAMRSQTILVQHRQDLVAETFSNQRNVDLWTNLQNQAKVLLDQANEIFQLVNRDSHHSASLYLGLTADPTGKQSAQLLQGLLTENWDTQPLIQALRSHRIILEAP